MTVREKPKPICCPQCGKSGRVRGRLKTGEYVCDGCIYVWKPETEAAKTDVD